jgi:tetratricopeptide (TPR) repeat protein
MELLLSFTDPRIVGSESSRRAAGRLQIVHRPARGAARRGGTTDFVSPLSFEEIEEIRWYLERFPGWPWGTFRERAARLEASLPEWGRALHEQTLAAEPARVSDRRRIAVEVADAGADGRAAAALLALPWELLGEAAGAQVVRRIPAQAGAPPPAPPADRLRVLLVLARPEQRGVGFLDPRTSARSLLAALAPLGPRAELEVIADGTFPALREALERAEAAGRPFQIVHFDGHGIYRRAAGRGALCFELPADADAGALRRRAEPVDAYELGGLLRERGLPLFLLDACQTAKAEDAVTASVAGSLVAAGVGSVLAMTHAVLVETSRRFVGRLYERLAQGEPISAATAAATEHLRADPRRGAAGGHGELHLQDWLVPVLFQGRDEDRPLFGAHDPTDPTDPTDLSAAVAEGELPAAPAHGFIGRARPLLMLQRRLRDQRCVTLLGAGGQGKTALAVECARWLLDLRLCERIAFVSVEDRPEERLLLERLGRQLVPGYSVARAEGAGPAEERMLWARRPIERALAEERTLLVVDNLESLLPAGPAESRALGLLHELSQIGGTRLLLTSRQALPEPLAGAPLRLGPLTEREARELIAAVLAQREQTPAGEADSPWVDQLLQIVGRHARSLVLLAPLAAEQGFQVTVESVARLMTELEKRHPGRRERSLLASVRLSLARLPEPARRQARALAVFVRAAPFEALAAVLEIPSEEAEALAMQLRDLGLAEVRARCLLPDPALGPAVADELTAEERRALESRRKIALLRWISDLSTLFFEDAQAALDGAETALPDLLAALAQAERSLSSGEVSPDALLSAATSLLQLVRRLGRPAALAALDEMCERLKTQVDWGLARFQSTAAEIERRIDLGDVFGAVAVAESLCGLARAAVGAYPESTYDAAIACWLLGRALKMAGRVEDALAPLDEAEERFDALAQDGDTNAAAMLGTVAGDRGGAWLALGRLDAAEASYRRAITIAERNGDRHSAAVDRVQLGSVQLSRHRLEEALATYERALPELEAFQDLGSVGIVWHQIGRVLEEAQHWDRAEEAYQRSLRTAVELGDLSGQASTLGQIGLLYRRLGRLEESTQLTWQAATIFEDLGQPLLQAASLRNLANGLRDLGRADEAWQADAWAFQLEEPGER